MSMSEFQTLSDAIAAAVNYRGDVTITLESTGGSITGYVFDRTEQARPNEAIVRILPTSGGDRITVAVSDIQAVELTGKDAAAGKSFERWVERYVQKKSAGEPANIECDSPEDD